MWWKGEMSRSRWVWILPVGLVAVGVFACGGDGDGTGPAPPPPPPPPPPPVATTVEVSPASVTLTSIGQTATFNARVLDQNGAVMTATVTWTSNAPSVFSVNASGVVTALANGTGTVQANVGSASGTAGVTVDEVLASDVWVASATVEPSEPTDHDEVEIRASVGNSGNQATGAPLTARLFVDGTEVATEQVEALDRNQTRSVTFTAGPFAAGTRQMRITADPGDAFEDSNPNNNSVEWSLDVSEQAVLENGSRLELSGNEGDEFLYRLDVAMGEAPVTVQLSGGTGDVDLYVHNGARPERSGDYFCISAQQATEERCHFWPAPHGTYHILVVAYTDFAGTTLEVTVGGEVYPFDIEVVFTEPGTAAQEAAVLAAAEGWENLISADIPDFNFDEPAYLDSEYGCTVVPDIDAGDAVDDIRLYVSLEPTDEDWAWSGQNQCYVRGTSYLTIISGIHYNPAIIDEMLEEGVDPVPLIMKAISWGFGYNPWMWMEFDLLKDPSRQSFGGLPGNDTHFGGKRAIAAFDAAGGSGYTGNKVPVTNSGEEAYGVDYLWRESVFGDELMSQVYHGADDHVISAITLQALKDLGYQVDLSRADPYSLPTEAGADGARGPSFRGFRLTGAGPSTSPIVVVDPKGRVDRVIRPR